jgi:hypothetical protein
MMRPLSPGVKGLECQAAICSRKNFIKTTNYARQHLKLGSDQMKTRYDSLANCASYIEGDDRWLYPEGKSPKLQSPWEGQYRVVTRINDVVYRIQRNPRSSDRLTPYQGTVRDERPWRGSSGSNWRVVTGRTEPRGRKARPITDVTITVLGKEEMAVRL